MRRKDNGIFSDCTRRNEIGAARNIVLEVKSWRRQVDDDLYDNKWINQHTPKHTIEQCEERNTQTPDHAKTDDNCCSLWPVNLRVSCAYIYRSKLLMFILHNNRSNGKRQAMRCSECNRKRRNEKQHTICASETDIQALIQLFVLI